LDLVKDLFVLILKIAMNISIPTWYGAAATTPAALLFI
jgi:hypothetical protein